MPTLLIRLAGPLQSWGSSSRFSTRGTDPAPTKSGVIGLIAAALGIPRDGSLERFAGLSFGSRADAPGTLLDDFQTAIGLEDPQRRMPLLHKHYLADAVFVVGIESADLDELEAYRQALRAPHYPLYLGRRSCPPDGPLRTWLSDHGLEESLRELPWQGSEVVARRVKRRGGGDGVQLGLVLEGPGEADAFSETVNDEPVSFNPEHRRYMGRSVHRPLPVRLPFGTGDAQEGSGGQEGGAARPHIKHDPWSAFPEEGDQ